MDQGTFKWCIQNMSLKLERRVFFFFLSVQMQQLIL